MRNIRTRRAAALAIACSLSLAVSAQTTPAKPIDIPPGDLVTALDTLARQTGAEFIYGADQLQGLRTPGVQGTLSPEAALGHLLEGSGYGLSRDPSGALLILKNDAPRAEPQPQTRSTPATTQRNSEPEEVQELERLTVTGTRIRGGVTASPTIVLSELQFRQEGFTDLGEVIRSIPQNFRGGQNPGLTAGVQLGGAANIDDTGGSSLNLRGLGPDATLTLLNGRRLSYDGLHQAVDISAIPIEAVERLEIVPDGASAIYGSDAVGGVGNVVLKRDFDGISIGAAYGDSADGGLSRLDYTATAGATWNSGGMIATFKKSNQDPMYADQRSYNQALDDPTTIYPETTLRSGLVSAYQELGGAAELRLDALRTIRTQDMDYVVSNFHVFQPREFTVSLVAPSLQVSLPREWALTVGGSLGKSEKFDEVFYMVDGSPMQTQSQSYDNESKIWEVGAEGLLMSIGRRDVRLAAGAGRRTNDFLITNHLSPIAGVTREENSRYIYGEMSLPIIGADNARPGVQRLEFSAAARSEDYGSFGGVTTPKLGVIYDPNSNFTVKASWGRSFKAPTLMQRYAGRLTSLFSAQELGCSSCDPNATVLMSQGGNLNLGPERARTWAASVAFHPEALPALDAELTFFDIDYTDRVEAPITNRSRALSDPLYAPLVQYDPSLEQQQQLIAEYDGFFRDYTGAGYNPDNVIAIVSGQNMNIARKRARGLDLSGTYRFDFSAGQLVLRGAASWLDLSQQSLPGEPEFNLSGMIYHPAELNSRLGAVWIQGGLSLSTFGNYISGVTSEFGSVTENTASFTTFDVTFRYETARGASALSGLTFALSIDNIFSRAPPLYTPPSYTYPPYDSTNYSAIGRYVTMSVSKHW